MKPEERRAVVRVVDGEPGKKSRLLRRHRIPRSTYYHWRTRLDGAGERPHRRRVAWNRLTEEEQAEVVQIALDHPDKSAREIAALATDSRPFAVSEKTVYRLLKARGLIRERPAEERPAEKEWRHPTRRVNELWQSDAATFFVTGWGYYKLILVQDDFSRYVVGWALRADETSGSISDAVERAIEQTGVKDWPERERPVLLSDNGPGYAGNVLAKYLGGHGIRHIFGAPYHPQTQGKVERLNRTLRDRLCLIVYLSPGQLERAIAEAIEWHNNRYHKALGNVSPRAVYEGRREEILEARRRKKAATLEARKAYNRIVRERLNRPSQTPGSAKVKSA